ncbi:MAG: DUF3416 domain-containing protein [Betaproteobacteria bacterium]|nr:DUF3416 domain-containing protein [Betaproteobacteria bacterium]
MNAPTIEGRARVVIEGLRPEVDGGRFPIKRTVGETVRVEVDAFTDGHDAVRCMLLHRRAGDDVWERVPMRALGNDRWRGEFAVGAPGRHEYTVNAWIDPFETWRHDLARREDPADVQLALRIGEALVADAARAAPAEVATRLKALADAISGASDWREGRKAGTDEALAALMREHAEPRFVSRYDHVLTVVVEPERARFSSWYEFFPRSAGEPDATHGTFADCERRLPEVAAMGFDVVYLPPIHPIGTLFRKGPNNTLTAGPEDPGSPWAIGSAGGGHKAVHPALGTIDDFRRLVERARSLGIDIALDIAFQCAPDHPYVESHPEWFRWRPDGTVQYAENPPKKYQDIYPFEFECDEWRALWAELLSVVEFWVDQGVRVFRVDNPHTKPFALWEWLIAQVKARTPDTIFLSEAFTRPRLMHRLAKAGFSQSYTYFAWRNTRTELTEYFTELAQAASREYFRPNLWPNTPDILPEFLQFGGRPAFQLRVALAATLGASYGIYGPAFELMEHEAREPGSEEYLDSEKYEIRRWDRGRPDSLRDYIARLNRIRRDNPALHGDWSLRFHAVDNERLLCFSKAAEDDDNTLVVVANLDPHHVQSGWVELPLEEFGIAADQPFQAHDLLSGSRFLWQGARNFVQLDPAASPVHIFRVRRRLRTERDFDYFL